MATRAKPRIEMIGAPIAHVQTPPLLNRMFERDGDPVRVVKRRVTPGMLDAYVAQLKRDRDVVGLVVTTPLKAAICAHLDRRTKLVDLLGSANCVRLGRDGWTGANFDGFGFLAAISDAGIDLAGRRVLLAGCGGAGKPIAARIIRAKAAALAIEDPMAERVETFVRRLRRSARGCYVTAGADPSLRYDVLVNATPLGMRRGDPSPFAAETVKRSKIVIDIVIAHQPSRLKRDARAFGKVFIGGKAMVAGQVALFRRFLTSDAADEATAARVPKPRRGA